MLSTMVDPPEATSRKELLTTPTGELAGVVDNILDKGPATAALKAVPRAGRSLLAALRKVFEAQSSN